MDKLRKSKSHPILSAYKKGWSILGQNPWTMLLIPLLLVGLKAAFSMLFPDPALGRIASYIYPALFLIYGVVSFYLSAKANLPWTDHVLLTSPLSLVWRVFLYSVTYSFFIVGLYFINFLMLYLLSTLAYMAVPLRLTLEILSYLVPLSILLYIEAELTPMRSVQLLDGNRYLKSIKVREDFLQGRRAKAFLLTAPLTLLFWLAFLPDLLGGEFDLWLRILAWCAQVLLMALPGAVHSSYYFQSAGEDGTPLTPPPKMPRKNWFSKHNPDFFSKKS
jgi:hypothetical protein